MRVETKYEKDGSSSERNILWWERADPPEFVVNIEEQCEMELVGGKTFNISKMMQEGLPVPPGFCVTTETYVYFMEYNNISEDDENISDKIREALMPPLLSEVLRDAYRTYLHGKSCAVRSSSPVEDLKNASFAGQYESFLNVLNEDDFLDAVKKCWASLWSRSATEYRKKMGIKNKDIKMAVLVQEMVPATASGVLFTEDPMIIEAVWGLGDLLVGGKTIPDRFVVETNEFKVVERKIHHKETMSEMEISGVTITDVPEHLQDQHVLEDEYLMELCKLGKKVEHIFGCPQDIEWVLFNDEIMLLQTRPITVKQTPTVWSRANISEMQPGYVTFLSRPPENRPDFFVFSTLPLLKCLGIKEVPENVKFAEYIYGHIYLNMTNLHDVLCKVPGLSPEMFDRSVGHEDEKEESISKPGIFEILSFIPGALKAIRFVLNLPSQAEDVIPYSTELIEDIKTRDLQKISCEKLEDLVWEMYDRNQKVFQVHTCNAIIHAALFDALHKFLKNIGEEGKENLLITGLEGMSSYRPGVEMWKLAQNAAKSSKVSNIICSKDKDILKRLNEFREGREFLNKLEDFIEKFDYRCSEEPEVSVPRWSENPDFVITMVAHFLDSTANPVTRMEEEKKIRLETTAYILKKLSKNPLEKIMFKKLLRRIQRDTVTRENLKTTWAKGLSAMRLLYLAIAEKLVKKGILKNRDDIFYLKMTELSEVIAENMSFKNLDNLINDRKKEKMECEHLDVPMTILGKPPPIEELKHKVEPKSKLEGVGCSHGMITGKARVIFDPNDCSNLKEGEILVAPVTDPGWSPLFVTAGGLVMELGSKTSHGVIIAREYGIPAVVGVRNATKIIKTGQLITIDGTKGEILIRD